MPTPKRGVRVEDVAARAGVSRATAARVLAGSVHVSPDAVARVRRAADELGYRGNAVARALASGTGYRIVVAVMGDDLAILDGTYLDRLVTAMARVAYPDGAAVAVQWLPLNDPVRPLRELAADRSVLGVALVNTTYELLAAVPAQLRGRTVSIGVGSADVASIDVDNAGGAAQILAHLHAAGRRRIAMIGGPEWLPCVHRAEHRYREFVADAGLECRFVDGGFTLESGRVAAAELLARWPDLDAVYAICDATALGAMAVVADHGRGVPDDVAVAGFDDMPFVEFAGLTTATHPVEEIGASAARALLGGRRAEPRTVYASQLVVRRTA